MRVRPAGVTLVVVGETTQDSFLLILVAYIYWKETQVDNQLIVLEKCMRQCSQRFHKKTANLAPAKTSQFTGVR